MARGNYALLSFELDGEENDGSLVGNSGIRAAIYKNWVYLYDEEAYREDIPYTKSPLVGKVEEGTMQYGDVKVYAERGPQQGVHAVIQTGYRHDDENPKRAIAALGVYGHGPDGTYRIPKEAAEYLPDVVSRVDGFKWADFVPYDSDHEYYYANGNPKYEDGVFAGHHHSQGLRSWE